MPDLAYRAELEKRTTEELYDMLVKAVPDVQVERRNRNPGDAAFGKAARRPTTSFPAETHAMRRCAWG